MFTTAPLFGKFHSPQAPADHLAQARAALHAHTLPQRHDIAAAFLPDAGLAPKASGLHSRQRIYSRPVTFWAFLSQTLSPDSSCRKAVQLVQSLYASAPEPRSIASATSPYCQARAHLCLTDLDGLRDQLASEARRGLPQPWPGIERRILLVDGTTLRLPDTLENQLRYPQPAFQKPGGAFPILRLVCLCDLVSGSVVGRARGTYVQAETRLFAHLWPHLKPKDIVVGDRLFCSFWTLASLGQRQVDTLFRRHSRRNKDFRQGTPLRRDQRRLQWPKPPVRSQEASPEQWAARPSSVPVRLLRFRVRNREGQVQKIILATTLLDPVLWPATVLAERYARRWQIELCWDDLKTTLKMDCLSCLSPGMIHRELEMHLLGYNLLRCLMRDVAATGHVPLARLSFKGTLDALEQFASGLQRIPRSQRRRRQDYVLEMLASIADDLVPERPGRREPRCIKRRPKPYPLMTHPRHQMQDKPKSHPRPHRAKTAQR